MKALIQRASRASVTVDGTVISSIEQGMVVLLGFKHGDTMLEGETLINKILSVRIFPDGVRSMEKNVVDFQGSILIVSQFTLYADCTKGNRPSFSHAMASTDAKKLYEEFLNELASMYPHVQSGEFGAHMAVELINDGPVTIELQV